MGWLPCGFVGVSRGAAVACREATHADETPRVQREEKQATTRAPLLSIFFCGVGGGRRGGGAFMSSSRCLFASRLFSFTGDRVSPS